MEKNQNKTQVLFWVRETVRTNDHYQQQPECVAQPRVWGHIVRKGLSGAGRAASGREKTHKRVSEREKDEKRNTKPSRSRAYQNLSVLSLPSLVPRKASSTQKVSSKCSVKWGIPLKISGK